MHVVPASAFLLLAIHSQEASGSSLTNLQAYSVLLGLNRRTQSDQDLMKLIAEDGVASREAREYAVYLKALHLIQDVASTFLKGAQHQVSGAERERLATIREELEQDAKTREQGGGGSGSNEATERSAVQEWKRKQLTFALASENWISDIDDAGNTAADGETRGDRDTQEDTLAWLDLAYKKVFAAYLHSANSMPLNKSQGRDTSANPRHSNKTNFKMGARELPHVPPWAYPYTFTPLTVYEFVSHCTGFTLLAFLSLGPYVPRMYILLTLDTEWSKHCREIDIRQALGAFDRVGSTLGVYVHEWSAAIYCAFSSPTKQVSIFRLIAGIVSIIIALAVYHVQSLDRLPFQ